MKSKKVSSILLGVVFAVEAVTGLLFLLVPGALSTTAAVLVICLSLASGLIVPNSLSLWFLAAGICMLVLPDWAVGICLLAFAAVGVTTSFLGNRK